MKVQSLWLYTALQLGQVSFFAYFGFFTLVTEVLQRCLQIWGWIAPFPLWWLCSVFGLRRPNVGPSPLGQRYVARKAPSPINELENPLFSIFLYWLSLGLRLDRSCFYTGSQTVHRARIKVFSQCTTVHRAGYKKAEGGSTFLIFLRANCCEL